MLLSYRLSSSRYREIIAEPYITNYDQEYSYENAEANTEPQAYWCVSIAHLHPGSANYGNVSPVILRLMHLTWVRTLCLVDMAIRLMNQGDLPAVFGSKDFAMHLLRTYTSEEPAQLRDAILNAREEFQSLMTKQAEGMQ